MPEDPTSSNTAGALPPYVAYQGDGDVTAPVVYVNYGMPDDYDALAQRGIDVKGKIVLARYGGGWRGLKPKLAQEHGAVGCLIYSDPADDGYAEARSSIRAAAAGPQRGVQRGSVADMTDLSGRSADARHRRNPGRQAPDPRDSADTILKIPALPISYADATKIIAGSAGPARHRQAARRSWPGLSLGRHRRGEGPPRGQVRLVAEAGLRRDRDASRQRPIPTSGSSAATTMTAGCSAPPIR